MLSKDAVIAHYLFSFCCFFASGTEILVGWLATLSGICGTIFLASALLNYSPLVDLLALRKKK